MRMREFSLADNGGLARRLRPFLLTSSVTLFALVVLLIYAMPVSYMFVTSLKNEDILGDPFAPLFWPAQPANFEYEGEDYPIYNVPTEEGNQRWALVEKGRQESGFIDPQNQEAGIIQWEGRWRALEPAWQFSPQWSNFPESWVRLDFGNKLVNSLIITVVGVVGTIVSSVMVAYGFARFRVPGLNIMFGLLIGTLMLPREILNVPLFAFYNQIGWIGTFWPLIVPHFFANALYVFLLRQYFRTLSRDVDEAAVIDGASPAQILWYLIVPQSFPMIATVGLLQFFFLWRDFYGPALYLAAAPERQPIALRLLSLGLGFGFEPHLVQAASIMALVLPLLVFLLTQRTILEGVAIFGRNSVGK